jgi:hypothetical protein
MLEKGDVIGPFESSELKKIEGFTLETLVCPETLGDNSMHWKPASFYIDFGGQEKVGEIKSGLTGGQNTKLTAGDNISIEEYFANIYQNENSGLSEILGIPDELENSDMYLGRFLQRELRPDSKTKNTKVRRIERELEKERRKYERTFGPQGKILSREIAPPAKEKTDFSETFRPITERGPAAQPVVNAAAAPAAVSPVPPPAKPAEPEPITVTEFALGTARSLKLKHDDGVKKAETAAVKTVKQDSPEDIFVKDVPAESRVEERLKTANPETDPDITFNVKRTQLKAQDIAAPKEKKPHSTRTLAAITALFIFAFLASMFYIYQKYQQETPPPQNFAMAVPYVEPVAPEKQILPPEVPAAAAVPAVLPAPPSSPKAKTNDIGDAAIAIAKNYFLENKNATVDNFLNTYFEQYRRQGYAAAWSSEALHKDIYIVKYRLTKTRQEPIVYIFEVDTKKGTVTGALNNLTLDLLDM